MTGMTWCSRSDPHDWLGVESRKGFESDLTFSLSAVSCSVYLSSSSVCSLVKAADKERECPMFQNIIAIVLTVVGVIAVLASPPMQQALRSDRDEPTAAATSREAPPQVVKRAPQPEPAPRKEARRKADKAKAEATKQQAELEARLRRLEEENAKSASERVANEKQILELQRTIAAERAERAEREIARLEAERRAQEAEEAERAEQERLIAEKEAAAKSQSHTYYTYERRGPIRRFFGLFRCR